MRAVACALALALLSVPVTGETQLYVQREPTTGTSAADDGQLRRGFAGPMPRTGGAGDAGLLLATLGGCALAAARVRDGPGGRGRRR